MRLAKTALLAFVVAQLVGFLAFTYWILHLDEQDIDYDVDGVYFNVKHGQILNGWFSVTFFPALLFRYCAGLEYIRALDLAVLSVFVLLRGALFLSYGIADIFFYVGRYFNICVLWADWVVIPVSDAIISVCDFFINQTHSE
jgi:hypothetical protein